MTATATLPAAPPVQTAEAPALVFLHIPKTAGQTVHAQLATMVGESHVSPVRLHHQAGTGAGQFPPGCRLYSGHIDWTALEQVTPRFTFTVLRDPRERIASFYFFLRAEAERARAQGPLPPDRVGMRMILEHSPDGYFLAGDGPWQRFVRDHYDNFYCAYLGTRQMRGWGQIADLDTEARVARALENLPLLDRVYSTRNLAALEHDIAERFGHRINVVGRHQNVGPLAQDRSRWAALMEALEGEEARARLEAFVADDLVLLDRLGLEV